MAKKNKRGTKPSSQEKHPTTPHVDPAYGEVLYSSSYSYTPSLENSAAWLVGPEHIDSVLNVSGGLICIIIVFLLTVDRGFLPIAIAGVALFVVVMAASSRIDRIRRDWLDGHGYDASLMSDEECRRTVSVTATHVIVEAPGAEPAVYPLSELKRVRFTEDLCLASFGKGRIAIFPRKNFGTGAYTSITKLLADNSPKSVREAAKRSRASRGPDGSSGQDS